MTAICHSLSGYSLFAVWHLRFIFIKHFRLAFAVVASKVKRNNCILFMTCLNVFKLKPIFSVGQLSELLFLLIRYFVFFFCVYIVLRPRTVICFYDVIFKLFFHTTEKLSDKCVETLTEFVVTGVVLTVRFDICLNGETKQQYCVHIYFLVSSVCG